MAEFGVACRGDDDGDGGAGGDAGATEDHVLAVAEGDLFLVQFPGLLLDRLRFPGEGGLDASERGGFEEAGIGGYEVAGFEDEDISDDELSGGERCNLTVASDFGEGSGQLLEGGDGLFSLELLVEANGGIEDDDG